jgi:hypothetical protein
MGHRWPLAWAPNKKASAVAVVGLVCRLAIVVGWFNPTQHIDFGQRGAEFNFLINIYCFIFNFNHLNVFNF